MVVHLLAFGTHCTKDGSSAELEIRSTIIVLLIDKEIFLLGTDVGEDSVARGVAQRPEHPHRLFVDCRHRTQKRDLLVQGFTGVGDERRGNRKGLHPLDVLHHRGTAGVPCGIAAGLESCSQTTVGK